MDDIRALLRDEDADVSPATLCFHLRGLNAVLHDLVREGAPADAYERSRYQGALEAVAFCAELVAVMLSRRLCAEYDAAD